MLNSQNTHLIETSYDRVEIKRNHISAIQENLAKAEFSDGLQISMNIKDHYYARHCYYLLRALIAYTNLSTLNHNVSFFRVSTGALA